MKNRRNWFKAVTAFILGSATAKAVNKPNWKTCDHVHTGKPASYKGGEFNLTFSIFATCRKCNALLLGSLGNNYLVCSGDDNIVGTWSPEALTEMNKVKQKLLTTTQVHS